MTQSATSTNAWGSARESPGARARRPTTSSARFEQAHGSNTTPTSWWATTCASTTPSSGSVTARASGTSCASTAIRARVARRACSSVPRRHRRGAHRPGCAARPVLPGERDAVGFVATSGQAARKAARDGRATARARSARPRDVVQRRSSSGAPRAPASTASARASGAGGWSRSKPSGCGTPTPAAVPDELRRAATQRIDDRKTACHRLEDDARARVVDLRVQQNVRAAEDRRRVLLRVAAQQRARGPRARVWQRSARPETTTRPVTSSSASG